MRRRRFLGVLLSLPVVGTAAGRAVAETHTPPVAAGVHTAAADESMAATLWGYLDHASSWDEAVIDLRRYVADGHADAEMFAAIADSIEHELARNGGDELEGTLGFFPGAVLMLHGLRSVRLYGDRQMSSAQAAFIDRMMAVV